VVVTELSGSARFCSGMFYVCPLSPPNGERAGVRGKHLKIKHLLTPAPFVIRANWRNLRIKTFFKKLPENGMVPFSFPQPLLKSRVMKERSWPSSPCVAPKEDRRRENLCLWPSVVKKLGPWCRSSTVTLVKTQKRLNEPNSKNVNPLLNIDDFTNCDFFKK
jgi:hypothetical protein